MPQPSSAPPNRQRLRKGRMAAWFFVCLFGFSFPLPFLPGPASQIRNTHSSPLSEHLGTFQILQARRPGGWVSITHPFLQAPSPGTSTGGWMLLCLPYTPHCWSSTAEVRLVSGWLQLKEVRAQCLAPFMFPRTPGIHPGLPEALGTSLGGCWDVDQRLGKEEEVCVGEVDPGLLLQRWRC